MKRVLLTLMFMLFAVIIIPNGLVAQGSKTYKLPPFIPISTYDIGSSAFMTISMACEGITQQTGQKFRLLPGSTEVARMAALRSGAVHFTSTGGGGLFQSAGRDEFANISWGPQEVRIVWCPAITGITLFVRGDSGIKKIADLKGKKVAFIEGSPGLNMQVTAHLAFSGLTWNDVEAVRVASYAAGCEGVISGIVDASAVVPSASWPFRLESSSHGVSYLPLPFDDDAGWKRAKAMFPIWTKYKAVSGAGVSKDKPLQCATYPNPIVLAYANQDADLVYWMTKNLAEAYPIFSQKAEVMKTNWTLDWHLDLTLNTAIPSHPGTIRYLKEIGKWTPELEAHNQELLQNKKSLIDLWKEALMQAGTEKVKDENFPAFWEKMRAAAGPKYAW
jgi:uncharacterized protein